MAHGVASIPLPGLDLGANGRAERQAPLALGAFYVGPENQLVHAVVDALLGRAEVRYSPLVLIGPTGVGKTHLAHGLAAHWRAAEASGEVLFFTGAEFARLLADAIEAGTMRALRTKLRSAGLLVLDDLSGLVKKPAALKELQFTLDALEEAGGQAIITSRVAPADLPQLPATLAGRLTGGLVLSLAQPGSDTRAVILQELALARGVALSSAAAATLAGEYQATVPELLAALVQLAAGNAPIDVPRARRFLDERSAGSGASLAQITACVASYFALKVADLRGASRNRTIATARSIAMYLVRQRTDLSLESIGQAFGRRDHTTVLHSCRKIEKLLPSDPATRLAVTQLQAALEQQRSKSASLP